MTVLVTGANGLLGTNVINELLRKGYKVYGYLRKKSSYKGIVNANLTLLEGNLPDVNGIFQVLGDVDTIIHCAAITNQNLLQYSDYYDLNIKSVKHLVDIAIEQSVSKFIYVSTSNVFGHGKSGVSANESSKMRYPFSESFYALSKLEASRYLKTKESQIEVVTVNPTFMIGAYDTKPSSGRIVLMGLKNRIVFCPPGGKNFVCVEDVANGIISVLDNAVNGASYIIGNENLSYTKFFKRLRVLCKRTFIIVKLPRIVLLFFGRIGDTLRYFGVRTNLSTVNMKAVSINNYYSNRKALEELRLTINPIEKGIEDAINWFKK